MGLPRVLSAPMSDPVVLRFEHGTLVATGPADRLATLESYLTPDPRTGGHRALALRYRDVVLTLHHDKVPYVDRARAFEPTSWSLTKPFEPFPHQAEALQAWVAAQKRGIVELPTGAGKTFLAVLAIVEVGRPTLVVVPTIDLMVQWKRVLAEHLGVPVGLVGGGEKDLQAITVTTYDSAQIQTEFWGNRFGLLVCDECHHLPAPAYRFIAEGSLAPFRLGLTATLERADGGEAVAEMLLGPRVYRASIESLEGDYLAPYEVRTVPVSLTDEEQERYDFARTEYLTFLRSTGIILSQPGGWARFIVRCHQSDEGRAAFLAYRTQRRIALTSEGKLDALWSILITHKDDRIIVFTEDNETVHMLSRRFLFPTITHRTKPTERVALLRAFSEGTLPVLLTSKVLNEGVDVPEANVGVVLSGSGSVREHVQRLGRILRKRPEKRAVLYEVHSEVAAESNLRERRRQHEAYARARETPESC